MNSGRRCNREGGNTHVRAGTQTILHKTPWERVTWSEDFPQLDQWLELAHTTDSLDDFRERVNHDRVNLR